MILVAGGTGRLGTIVVPNLVGAGHDVRVFCRDPGRGSHRPGPGLDIVRGDVRDPISIEAAMDGVTTVVSAVQGFAGRGRVTPESVDRDGNANLVDAARRAGADVVLMSVVGAAPDSPMELFRAKYAAEEHLRDSGTPWTIVRATAFLELWAEILGRAPVLGRGDNPINFVAVRDVAAVVERAVERKDLRGEVVEVGGPGNVTLNELAALVQEVRGTHRKTRHIPRWLLRVLAYGARQPRAALTMDTIDMTFEACRPERASIADISTTEVRTALAETLAHAKPHS
jgi:NADH dehydrogenase